MNAGVYEKYRYGYQGEYSEYDEETEFNHFELRDYDPVIGRWMAMDPYGQFWSPYNGMGNSPVNGVDPDGGLFGIGKNGPSENTFFNRLFCASCEVSSSGRFLFKPDGGGNPDYPTFSGWVSKTFEIYPNDNLAGMNFSIQHNYQFVNHKITKELSFEINSSKPDFSVLQADNLLFSNSGNQQILRSPIYKNKGDRFTTLVEESFPDKTTETFDTLDGGEFEVTTSVINAYRTITVHRRVHKSNKMLLSTFGWK